ncbi:MAG: DegT/DnrJ/EryC1/StrS family aminotransferase [Candidatus Solibacter sp.]
MIPLLDLKAQYRNLKSELDAAVQSVMENAQFILGPEVAAFEKEFAAHCGAREALGLNSGTSALHLALLAAGICAGDEVITTPFTFIATAAAIAYTGATPVFVDIEPATFNIDVAQIERAITARTKAILPVHLFGQPADLDPILEIARRHRLVVIEDAAQSHGAEYKGRRVGAIGDIGCFSFYPGKNLGACGEGGAVVSNHPELIRKMRMLRDWGSAQKYLHELKGYNYRMEGMQGAVLRVKLRHLDAWTEARRAHAARYGELLKDCAGIQVPPEMPYARHVYHVYNVRCTDRAAVRAQLEQRQIQSGIHYPIPVHLQPAYADLGLTRGAFPVAERAAEEVLALPIFPEMTAAQIEEVAGAVRCAATAGPVAFIPTEA